MKLKTRRIYALLLVSVFLLTACGQSASAAVMQLARTEGTVGVQDDGGRDLSHVKKMNLYSGYQVGTKSQSYAWIDLDKVKLVKMDEDSDVELQKNGKTLEILVNSGSLFFNITEPLAEDETMNIRTSTMAVGIRGTCGWVRVLDECHMQVYILEGTVQCEVSDPDTSQSVTESVSDGEMADLFFYPDAPEGELCAIFKKEFSLSEIPAFVLEETDPEALGIELAEENTEKEPQKPILILSGYTGLGMSKNKVIPAQKDDLWETLQSDFDKYGLICNVELDKEYPYTTLTSTNKDISTNGTVLFSNYRIFESDEDHEGIEGYEWRSVDVTFTYADDNAWDYGTTSSPFATDFYHITGPKKTSGSNKNESNIGILDNNDTYKINFNGIDYSECFEEDHALVMEWNSRVYTCKIQFSFRVPIGYDGSIVGAIGDGKYNDGDYIYEVADENTLFFRLE